MPHVGELAPEFELPSDTGTQVKLSSFRGKKVILYFFSKAGTSGWSVQADGFRDESARIAKANGVVVGVSPDSPAALHAFREQRSLPFVLLSDPEHKVIEAFGAWGEKKMYGKSYMGVIRSHLVIDEKGRIVDVRIKVSPEDSVKLAVETVTS